jgi:uncharacterized protein YoxC
LNEFTQAILKLLKDVPYMIFAILVIYIFAVILGNKLDKTNEILTEINKTNVQLIDRMVEEGEDTKVFVEKQNEVLDKVSKIEYELCNK